MQAMPNAIKYLANEGITFNNTFISTPICCPSRTETISGRHFHNIKNIDQGGKANCMHISPEYNIFNNTASFFQIFKSNGYKTGAFGKVVNNQNEFWCVQTPNNNGFDRIHCPCDQGNFYGQPWYDYFENGTMENTVYNITADLYQTSMIGNASYKFIENRLKDNNPFIVWIAPIAPHYPAVPAAWYADRYDNITTPITPNFNRSDDTKHSFVGTNPYISDVAKEWIDQLYRDRLRSLLSVDDLIFDIINLLMTDMEIFESTYFLYTSDHGYHC